MTPKRTSSGERKVKAPSKSKVPPPLVPSPPSRSLTSSPQNKGHKIKIPDVDKVVDESKFCNFDMKELRGIQEEAFLGFVSMNVVDPPVGTYWGKFNNRVLNNSWVQKMLEKFIVNLDNTSNENSMDVALDPEWLENPKDQFVNSVTKLDIDAVPKLKFNQKGLQAIKKNNLWMLSGNHRRMALTAYVAQIDEDIATTKEAIKELTAGKTTEDIKNLDEESIAMLRDSTKRVELLEQKRSKSRFWTVKVYDRGESCYGLRMLRMHDRLTSQSRSQDRT
jgi:hypothetical protein